jgi:DNA polymerase-3 subunit gamma/tau
VSYLVLARKYRPETFAKVVGQEPIARTLQNALKTGRLAHAYLLTGPRGVGKTSMARILAKALRCEKGPTPDPCLACVPCKAVAAGHDLDVIEIDGASNRGIENIRDLRESVRYAATGGKYKVYIVDEVHQITQDAFNAFLKTLEEPPPNVVFVFATTEPRKVPETIRSRCQEFEVRRISEAAIAGHLRDVCAGEQFELASGLDVAIARRARGGLRDALSLLDQLAAFGAGKIGHESFQQLTGYLAPERVRELFDALVARDVAAGFAWLDGALAHGTAAADLFDQWLEHLRALLHQRVGSTRPPELAGVPTDALAAQARAFDETQLLGAMQVVIDARRALRDLEDERLVLEMALVELARIRELESLRDAIANAGATATTRPAASPPIATPPRAAPMAAPPIAPPPAPMAAPMAAPAAASPAPAAAPPAPPAPTGLAARYEQLRAAVHKEAPSRTALFDAFVPVREEAGTFYVVPKPGAAAVTLPHAALDDATRRAGKRLFQAPWVVRLESAGERAAPVDPQAASQLLSQVKQLFGGETVSGTGQERSA